ncbi:MAG: hypothetical protein IJS96_05040 [Schwartzia sp.]|nr:hypothetical protein [Schwartzia sp. (in: firmicutes)]
MDYIEAINQAGMNCLMAENELSMHRLMGGLGTRKMKAAKETHEAAMKALFDVLRASGRTVEELETLRDENGNSPFTYGILEMLRRDFGKY